MNRRIFILQGTWLGAGAGRAMLQVTVCCKAMEKAFAPCTDASEFDCVASLINDNKDIQFGCYDLLTISFCPWCGLPVKDTLKTMRLDENPASGGR